MGIDALITYLLPPLLGAVIGYTTNAIAIKMLFRPLKPWFLGSFRLPLTPGVIPRQRHALAESIGNMVALRLLTPEAIRKHIGSGDIHVKLFSGITQITSAVIDTPLSSVSDGLTNPKGREIKELLNDMFKNLAGLQLIQTFTDRLIESLLELWLNKPLTELFPAWQTDTALFDWIMAGLTTRKTEGWVRKKLGEWVSGQLAGNLPLSGILSRVVTEWGLAALASLLPFLSAGLVHWMRTNSVKVQLAQVGRNFLLDILDKLNLFQRFFVSVAQYDKTLHLKMPQIVDDGVNRLEEALSSDDLKRNLLSGIKDLTEREFNSGLRDIAEKYHLDIAREIDRVVVGFFRYLRMRAHLRNPSDAPLAPDHKMVRAPLGEVLALLFNQDRATLTVFLRQTVTGMWKNSSGTGVLKQAFLDIFAQVFLSSGVTLGSLFGISVEFKARLDEFLLGQTLVLLDAHLPDVIGAMDIRKMVIDKVDSLDVEQVESLLLMVIAKQLKWINIFGAILGALIGFVQVIMGLFI